MAAGHADLCVGINFYGLIQLVNSSPEGLTEDFGDHLTWSEYTCTTPWAGLGAG